MKNDKNCRSMAKDTSGNVAMIFALTSVMLIASAGAAIDYVRLINVKQSYSAAADSAVLAAIAAAVKAEVEGKGGVSTLAQATAQSTWDANVANLGAETSQPPTISVTKSGAVWTADITYSEPVNLSFMGLLGLSGQQVAGKASSSTTLAKLTQYWDFSVVVDDSSSMGIGATQVDMDKMIADPNISCAFACHWDSSNTSDSSITARANGYKLRVDVVDEAVDGMVDEMKAASDGSNVKAGLYGLDNTVHELVAPTTTLQDVADHDIKLSLTTMSTGNTNYRAALADLTAQVGTSGDGASAASPKKAVFIVTDGVHDSNVWESNVVSVVGTDHQDGPIDPAFCQSLKDAGVTVGVLYIDYIVPSGFEGYVSAFQSDLLPKLEACASPGLFYNATTPANIKQAMVDMLGSTFKAGSVRLTQ
jgi:Flp pilus assembly protein TadG